MSVKLSEKDCAFIRQAHKAFAEPGTLCQCGGELNTLLYDCDGPGMTSEVCGTGERFLRRLKVCEECGAVYAMKKGDA